MHARIGTFEAPPQGMNELVAFFRGRVVSAFSEDEGFLGYGIHLRLALATMTAGKDTA